MVNINSLNETFTPRARLDKLPDEFLGRALHIVEGEDKNYPGYKALYMEIAIEDPAAAAQAEGEVFTQKMRAMHVHELLEPAMYECDVKDTEEFVGKSYLYRKKYVSFEGSNPRWVPVPTNGHKGKGKKGKRTA